MEKNEVPKIFKKFNTSSGPMWLPFPSQYRHSFSKNEHRYPPVWVAVVCTVAQVELRTADQTKSLQYVFVLLRFMSLYGYMVILFFFHVICNFIEWK